MCGDIRAVVFLTQEGKGGDHTDRDLQPGVDASAVPGTGDRLRHI
ncbi:hypothetical protein SCHAM137S_01939 [Streptomyces chartreusis]